MYTSFLTCSMKLVATKKNNKNKTCINVHENIASHGLNTIIKLDFFLHNPQNLTTCNNVVHTVYINAFRMIRTEKCA